MLSRFDIIYELSLSTFKSYVMLFFEARVVVLLSFALRLGCQVNYA